MSLNILIETRNGFDYSFNDFDRWVHQIDFIVWAGSTNY